MPTRRDPEKAPPAPDGWETVWSATRKRWYFRNQQSKETAWEVPAKQLGEPAAPTARPSNRSVVFDDLSTQHHLLQVIQNQSHGYVSRTDLEFRRILRRDSPREAYRRRNTESKTVINWPQRRLLISEVEFLSKYSTPGMTVVYAAAAPGVQIKPLSDLFPDLQFVLFDALPLTPQLAQCKNVAVRQENFSDAVAREYADSNVLFISNLRSGSELDGDVADDLAAQASWTNTLKPTMALLKFRLPWQKGATSFFDGDIYLPAWSPPTGTESRMIVNPSKDKMVDFDNNTYEEQMFYFNTVQRLARYQHDVADCGMGIDHCYDCKAEVTVLEEYLGKTRDLGPGEERNKAVADISARISSQLASRRTLLDPNPDPDGRNKGRKRGPLLQRPSHAQVDKRARPDTSAPAPEPEEDEWA